MFWLGMKIVRRSRPNQRQQPPFQDVEYQQSLEYQIAQQAKLLAKQDELIELLQQQVATQPSLDTQELNATILNDAVAGLERAKTLLRMVLVRKANATEHQIERLVSYVDGDVDMETLTKEGL
jgi:hypothetical protein